MITIIIGEVAILYSKLLPQHPLRNFPKVVCSYSNILILLFMHVSLNFQITCSYTYINVVGCYAACRNNNHSGQEEATLCIVKCLEEDRKLVFQMRNKVFNNNIIG